MAIRIYIVDDHQLFIDGLKSILAMSDEIEVVGEANHGQKCLEDLNRVSFDVLLTDISMPGMNGEELSRLALAVKPDLKIITLSMHQDFSYINAMIKAGVQGYILKNTGARELKAAILTVYSGANFYSEKVKEIIIQGFSSDNETSSVPKWEVPKDVVITPQEKKILNLVINGMNSNEIAEMLEISYHTVTVHRKNINAKLGVSTISELHAAIKKMEIRFS